MYSKRQEDSDIFTNWKARTYFFRLFLLFFITISPVCGYASTDSGAAEFFKGRVIEVIDGDTIKVRLDEGSIETVRYLLIDTPEVHHPKRGMEEMGKDALRANKDIVGSKQVFLETDILQRDRYGRLLAYVWLDKDKKILVNEKLVEKGFALPLIIPPNEKYVLRIHQALEVASSKGLGLWGRAEGRDFTAGQAWAELPYLKGNFVTLGVEVRDVLTQKRRSILLSEEGYFSVIIYESDMDKFSFLFPLQGKILRIVGKITAGYHGGEMLLKDPLQIMNFYSIK